MKGKEIQVKEDVQFVKLEVTKIYMAYFELIYKATEAAVAGMFSSIQVLGPQHVLFSLTHKNKKKKLGAALPPSEAAAHLIFQFVTFSIWICDSNNK